jgi:hypothetical protein
MPLKKSIVESLTSEIKIVTNPKCFNDHCDDHEPESKNGCRYSDDPQNCMAYLPKLKGDNQNETKLKGQI